MLVGRVGVRTFASLYVRAFIEGTCSAKVAEDTEVLPKSHLHGALQRVLGRDVYKSETPFFYRTTERGDFYYGLLRIPALPRKNPDGSKHIPARPFRYCGGKGESIEDCEQEAARKALSVIRSADSETARWLSWAASTSKQALELQAAQLADARQTDGQARQRLNRALAVIHGRTIKAHAPRPRNLQEMILRRCATSLATWPSPFEVFSLGGDDPDSCHVVLRLPWKGDRFYYFEGSGLTPLLAKESAAEGALKILKPMAQGVETQELPWRRERRRAPQSVGQAARDEKAKRLEK